ncbi:CGA/CIA family class A beta-lactamase [Chryseobacterium balustinum]|uniref:beta-lactamase n=1 Tax=Chryseobacterium balustinum TaxID=246 RepID=A0ABY1LDJ2_9FLAO|nr:CGA/CIA family class A beta-lactamase [Chryseobacterium balustinum]AZB29983.1 CGA/CIA family class A beta-lactamase [Chryseobacterium balustinum]SKC05168.1 beta-lactamase class A [Chryseobacterium balustinum]
MKKTAFLFLLISAFTFAQKSVLAQKVDSIIKDKKATVGVSVLGFEDDFKYNKNATTKLPMLSVFKFHIAATVLDLVDKGKLSLGQKILIKKGDLLENTWSPIREKYPNGNVELPLSEIINYTVAWSDNNGCDILLRLIGGAQVVQKFMDSKGVKDFQIKHNEEQMHKEAKYLYENYTTTNSLSQLYKKFYDGKILSEKSTKFLYDIMLNTSTGGNKLKEQLPKQSIAHKTGSSGKDGDLTIAENDSGIVTLPNGKHYAVVVFISNSTETDEVNCKMISDISKAVWDYFNK